MNKYSYYHEEKALKAELISILARYDELLVKLYLKRGFTEICALLKLDQVWQRKLLFDYLVFEKKVVLKCIVENKKFFLELIGKGQGSIIRHILGIQFCKYNKAWKEALDFLNQLYTQKLLEDKLFHLASKSFFHLSEKLKRKHNLD